MTMLAGVSSEADTYWNLSHPEISITCGAEVNNVRPCGPSTVSEWRKTSAVKAIAREKPGGNPSFSAEAAAYPVGDAWIVVLS
jgi:hypothetical protein